MTGIDLAHLSTGTSDFAALRMRGQIYVDKTEQIYQLACRNQKILLTRPRRFGKSLLASTFASLFKNGLRDFSGLAIENLWEDSIYPVVRLDFSLIKVFDSFDDFKHQLERKLARTFAQVGFQRDATSEMDVISQLSSWMKTLPPNSLVLLIDEYDAPCTACLEDIELCNKVRALLGSFYEIISLNEACLRFAFVTGITKYHDFGLNDFTDISLDKKYGSLVGFTEDEIHHYFADYLEYAADQLKLSYEEILNRLRDNYGGYCFDDQAVYHVCQPWSVLQFLGYPDPGFRNYWIKSGGSITKLERYIHSPALTTPVGYGKDHAITRIDLNSLVHEDAVNDLALLFQAGYLTIKQQEEDTFFVNYPNQEVLSSMSILYARFLLDKKMVEKVGGQQMVEAFFAGDADAFFAAINDVFAAIDGTKYPINNEDTCQRFLRIILADLGFEVISENQEFSNRNTIEWFWRDNRWSVELKFQHKGDNADTLLAEAVQQIRNRNYGASSSKPLVRAAAVFSEEKRAFVCWQNADAK